MFPSTAAEGAGAAAVLLSLIGFVRFFIWRRVKSLEERLEALEEKYDDERGLKHKAYNDVARTTMALDLVQRLATECECGVLSPLEQVIGRLVAELETMPHARLNTEEAT